MQISVDPNDYEKVSKVLGEPVGCEFQQNTQRIRVNLILVSAIVITLVLGGIDVNPEESSFLGLKFQGLNNHFIFTILLYLNGYLFIHFIWSAFDELLEWIIRITGTRRLIASTAQNTIGDYPINPRSSTLYTWWSYQVEKVAFEASELEGLFERIKSIKDELSDEILNLTEGKNAISQFNQIGSSLGIVQSYVKGLQEIVLIGRVPASLKRFDAWYMFFCRYRNFGWFLFEFLIPVLIAGYAIALLIVAISFHSL